MRIYPGCTVQAAGARASNIRFGYLELSQGGPIPVKESNLARAKMLPDSFIKFNIFIR